MTLFIGIEGVRMRESVAVLSDETGRILSSVKGKPISLHTTERNQLRMRISELLTRVMQHADIQVDILREAIICIGLAGVTFPYDAKNDLPKEFELVELPYQKLICTGDAEIIFAAFTQSNFGSAIVSGMGSTAYAIRPEMQGIRFGGWGPTLGDEGSAYWMGRAALRAIGEQYDRGQPKSLLWEEISKWLNQPQQPLSDLKTASIIWKEKLREFEDAGFDARTAIFVFSHEMSRETPEGGQLLKWRTVASSLSVPLFRAWDAGDSSAKIIVEDGADELVKQHCAACQTAGIRPNEGNLVLAGGLLTHHPIFYKKITSKINKYYNCHIDPIMPRTSSAMRPVCGALLFALGDSQTGDLHLPNESMIERIRVEQAIWRNRGELINE